MSTDEERKKLMTEKTKYVVRLNKIIEHTKSKKQVTRPKKIKELKKVYAYCVEGNLEELEYIWSNLKNNNNNRMFLEVLYYWVLHSEQTISYSKEAYLLLKEISTWLLKELWETGDVLLLYIAIEGWRIFQVTTSL